MMNQLETLRTMTQVVADTGDIDAINQYKPVDATTNPSLLFKAAQLPQYEALGKNAVRFGKSKATDVEIQSLWTFDKLGVNFGKEILKIVPGRVSTEVDARLSFDTEGTIQRAKQIIALYKDAGVDSDRILIKIASTWEGIQAAKVLEQEGIHCNMTLLFSFAQAVACAEANVTLISPFVGRIMDWYKKADGTDGYPAPKDPGVKSVTQIYNYYKKHGHKTVVMGASFRNKEEILELAGCDYLTISPGLMQELQKSEETITRKLDADTAQSLGDAKISMNENTFRWMMNEDAMATEKLAEGIRNFTKDTLKLETFVRDLCKNC
ncbi:transaldolase [candidate division KSB1 bacterium]|nr:transaldolase [candidate division KSB1 bacterium]